MTSPGPLSIGRIRLFLLVCLALLALGGYGWHLQGHATGFGGQQANVHLALAVPLSGPNLAVGTSFKKGVDLAVADINRQGGIQGKQLVIDPYDDEGEAQQAALAAARIVADQQALAVIGHSFSSCSLAGGEVYQQAQIPAITGQATNVMVTQNNPWYFRSLFNDRFQGRFLTNYISKISPEKNISIIHEDLAYGRELAQIISTSARQNGLNLRYQWGFSVQDSNLAQRFADIASELYTKIDAGIVIIACHTNEGSRLIQALKDGGITNKLVLPHTFDSQKFMHSFAPLPREQADPGHYTNGIYVLSPLIFATANSKAQQFRQRFRQRYQQEPEWRAAYGYDTVMILAQAMMASQISGKPQDLKSDRQRIQQFLQSLNRPEIALAGITGLNYFDEHGDAIKPVSVGIFKGQTVTPAPIQLQAIRQINNKADLFDAQLKGDIINMDNQLLHRTHVVFTGAKINRLSEINLIKGTARLDFNLWFSYQGKLDTKSIEFRNAMEPIQLGPPVKREDDGEQHYVRYHGNGIFQLDFLPRFRQGGQHLVGISFQHRDLPRHNLVFVTDTLGMAMAQQRQEFQQDSHNQITPPGWQIDDLMALQDVNTEISQGDLIASHDNRSTINVSTYTVFLTMTEEGINLANIIPLNAAQPLAWGGGVTLVALLIILGSPLSKRLASWHFFALLLVGTIFLLALRPLMIQACPREIHLTSQLLVGIWWLLLLPLAALACRAWLWNRWEKWATRPIPPLLSGATLFLIGGAGILAILVLMLHQPQLAWLLATIIGLALIILGQWLQPANIIAALTIWKQDLFRVGDHLTIQHHGPGEVLDIAWQTTALRLADQTIITIPNSLALTAPIRHHAPIGQEADPC